MKTTNEQLELCSAMCRAREYADKKHRELVAHDAERVALAAAAETADEIYEHTEAVYNREHLNLVQRAVADALTAHLRAGGAL